MSKRAEMYLPDLWPAYYAKAKGFEVWDLEDRKYFDFCMSPGTCILGYANPQVNERVKEAIDRGSSATLNCHEEVTLAQKLIELHPWAEQVRFARTGGEACAIAIRIARAASRKDKVAFCGYHGWHDWYLSANLSDSQNLDGQLLPGLQPSGVPRALRETAHPFHYGKIEELEKIVSQHDIGVIITEFTRHPEPDLEFLKAVQKIAQKQGAVLIFDETSSGYRTRAGGQHIEHQISPDMCVLGKAMGNGFAITSILGKKSVMEAAQGSFISSSFWSERVGPVAALEVIRQFEEDNAGARLVENGRHLKKSFQKVFDELRLNMKMVGLDSVPTVAIFEKEPLVWKTAFTQEMLKKGFLATNLTFISTAYQLSDIDRYVEVAGTVLQSLCNQRSQIQSVLEGAVSHSGFERLT